MAAAPRGSSLSPGSAPYRLLYYADLPQEWLEPLADDVLQVAAQRMRVAEVTTVVCVEIPDYPWAWHYFRWWQRESELAKRRGELPLPIMLAPRVEFRRLPTGARRRQLADSCLRSLLDEGIPLRLFLRSFGELPR